MTTDVDDLTPFDMQVLNLARLQYDALEYNLNSIGIPDFGVFEYIEQGRMQVAGQRSMSKWFRALSPAGGRELAKLHQELCFRALDTEAWKEERRKEIEEKRAAVRSQLSQNIPMGPYHTGGITPALQAEFGPQDAPAPSPSGLAALKGILGI